jgi:hypothetical protein
MSLFIVSENCGLSCLGDTISAILEELRFQSLEPPLLGFHGRISWGLNGDLMEIDGIHI